MTQMLSSVSRRVLVMVAILACLASQFTDLSMPVAHAASTATYSATQTIPVPPASTYAGSGGGDGWAIALSSTSVYNVFHHSYSLTVACHLQSDASPCWNPETITDSAGDGFATPGQPGLWLDQNTGKLYTFATRTSDNTGGVVCIDTSVAATNPDPFCGFTQLTAVGEAPVQGGISALSAPAQVNNRLYAFNYVNGSGVAGTQNKLLCFDLSTLAACGSQPFGIQLGASGTDYDNDFPEPAVASIAGRVIVPFALNGSDELACYDPSASSGACVGSWPIQLGFGYDSIYGAPFPVLTSSGAQIGFCLPTGNDPCFDLSGATLATPTGMTAAVSASSGWNGAALTVGPRVYVPNGNGDAVDCYDYAAAASCANFPKGMSNLGLLYTVNPDPQRPACIWVNSDNGSGQIQNFDAYTGSACGQGPIRVLASSFVVATQLCWPASYTSLQVQSPPRNSYSSGTVAFEDGSGNPISGMAVSPVDNTGTVDLSGLNFSTVSTLPQFLITLNGASSIPAAVVVALTWTGTYDPSCVKPGTTVTQGGPPPNPDLCGNGVVFVAVPGSGEYYKGDTNLDVSPALKYLYRNIRETAGGKKIGVRVLNYPAASVSVLTSGLQSFNWIDGLLPGVYLAEVQQQLANNISSYLSSEQQGVAALWKEFLTVRSKCPPSTKFVIGGYSQGAMVVHDFLNQLADTSDSAGQSSIIGAVLLADPDRVKNSGVIEFSTAPFSSFGVCDFVSLLVNCAGGLQLSDVAPMFQSRTVSVCSYNDPVCDTSDLAANFIKVIYDPQARASYINLAKVIHGSYSYIPATATAGKLVGRWVAKL